jgi:hypothetical protein
MWLYCLPEKHALGKLVGVAWICMLMAARQLPQALLRCIASTHGQCGADILYKVESSLLLCGVLTHL